MPGQEKTEQHVNEKKGRDFEEPETDHPDCSFKEKSNEKAHDKRTHESDQYLGRRPAFGEIISTEEEN